MTHRAAECACDGLEIQNPVGLPKRAARPSALVLCTPERATVPNVTHPKCGKSFPNNNTHGHCGNCCETFSGLSSYDAHRHWSGNERYCKILPYDMGTTENGNPVYGHWQDDNGYWKYGKKLTEAEKRKIFGRYDSDEQETAK